ncbi:MAG: sigma 54-interacting transcriptional regulator [Polyangiaceae bacterium]
MRRQIPHDATLPLGERARSLVLDCFSLAVVDGPDRGLSARGSGREMSCGSAEGNDLKLTDPSVSRHHFSVTSLPDGFMVRDLGSTNGTRVNGVLIERGYLDDDATIEIGRTKIRFEPLPETVPVPLSASERCGRILGQSSVMRRIFAMLPSLASSMGTLLIEGETGTGKGALASAIHEAGPRASAPFVVLDCASIPPTLVESELFGHMRGSFTGAHADRPGAFEQAAGGTIFLDEIGELPLDMQPKLLRALEERTVKRVGGRSPVKLDVRVIAATNRDLRAEANRGTFRSDLYYRLNVLKIEVPALRQRRDDIPLLAQHFYEQLRPGRRPPEHLLESLMRQPWPGNVRELRSAVERWVLMDDLGPIEHELASIEGGDSPQDEGIPAGDAAPNAQEAAEGGERVFEPNVPFRVAKEKAVAIWEKRYLEQLMTHAGWNLSQAARLVDSDRSHIRELLRKYGLRING